MVSFHIIIFLSYYTCIRSEPFFTPPYCTNEFPSEEEMIKYRLINESLLIPELIRTLPQQVCKVTYPSGFTVEMGNTLNKTETNSTPIVEWSGNEGKYHCLMFVNTECPGPRFNTMGPFMHWMVVNIPGTNITAGRTIYKYLHLLSPPDTDWHRYVFLIYEQPGKLYFKLEGLDASIAYRGPKDVNEIQLQYGLRGPIAINYFFSLY